ncbi:MAG: hypothetical protein ACRCXZ_00615 [Patescibacteria group bacterium]
MTFAQDSNNEYDLKSEYVSEDNKNKLEDIKKIDPDKPELDDFKLKGGKIVSNTDGLKKEFNEETGTIKLDNNKSKIEFNTPKELDNPQVTVTEDKIIYNLEDKKLDVVVENIDGGLRQVIIINSSDQPNRYQFPVKLEEGQYFRKNVDETVSIMNKENQITSTILKPWARDRNGKKLQTYFEVEPRFLNQFINFDGAEFPVSADPTWCGDFFSSINWVKEDDIYKNGRQNEIIEAKPTWCLKYLSALNPLGSPWLAWDSWKELYDKTKFSWEWTWENRRYGTDSYWSIHNQMACHIDGVKFANAANKAGIQIQGLTKVYRDSYHLEPRTPNYGWVGFLKRGCNDVTPVDERAWNKVKSILRI